MIHRFRTGPEPKPNWRSIPPEIKAAVEDVLGRRVVSGRRIWGGYGPSATFRLGLEDGSAAFFKGASSVDSDFINATIRREMRVYAELPGIQPWAPRQLGAFEANDWQILLLEFVPDSKGAKPWNDSYIRATLEGLAALHNAFTGRLKRAWPPSVAESLLEHPDSPGGWRSVLEDAEAMPRLAALAGPARDEAIEWLKSFAPVLSEVERRIAAPQGADTLLHMDVRSDNLLFRKDGSMVLVDWPHVRRGTGVMDAATFLITVEAEGGPPPEKSLPWYEEALDSPVATDDLVSAVAFWAGFFASYAGLPDIPGLPRLRPWQRAQFVVALRWLARLLELPAPAWLSEIRGSGEPVKFSAEEGG
ncbi:MAG: aminoglycoside phosphotransferase family protein [Chloroflexi bacterium]|nr:aminoglycoside phosphotransferase family protein [Chloroflexota bacterium]